MFIVLEFVNRNAFSVDFRHISRIYNLVHQDFFNIFSELDIFFFLYSLFDNSISLTIIFPYILQYVYLML